MKKKINLIVKILFLTVILALLVALPVFATSTIITDEVTPGISGSTSRTIASWGSQLLGIVQFACNATAVGMMIYVSIKYMTSAANERADLKGLTFKYIFGALLLFCAPMILNAIWTSVQQPSP